MTPVSPIDLALVSRVVAPDDVRLDVPVGWSVEVGPPTIAMPSAWPGEAPAIVVSVENDGLRGQTLAAAVAGAALTRLNDAVIVNLAFVGETDVPDEPDETGGAGRDDVEIVVAHRHRGVDLTTVERHHRRPGPARWVVGFTAAHPDVPRLLPLARRVVASLTVGQ